MSEYLPAAREDVFDVCEGPTHVLTIELRGAAVVNLTPHTQIGDLETIDSLLDLPAVFAVAARAGMFASPATMYQPPTVTLDGPSISGVDPCARWRMGLHGVDASGVRALWHTLRSLPVASRSIHDSADLTARRLTASTLPNWIEGPVIAPFAVEWTTPTRSNRPRSARIEFSRPPSTDVVDQLLLAIDAWTTLVMSAGFPENAALPAAEDDGSAPDNAPFGGFPSGAILEDDHTISVHFDELQHCSESMFASIVRLAAHAQAAGRAAVARVHIA
jgi:hypothetical protein